MIRLALGGVECKEIRNHLGTGLEWGRDVWGIWGEVDDNTCSSQEMDDHTYSSEEEDGHTCSSQEKDDHACSSQEEDDHTCSSEEEDDLRNREDNKHPRPWAKGVALYIAAVLAR